MVSTRPLLPPSTPTPVSVADGSQTVTISDVSSPGIGQRATNAGAYLEEKLGRVIRSDGFQRAQLC